MAGSNPAITYRLWLGPVQGTAQAAEDHAAGFLVCCLRDLIVDVENELRQFIVPVAMADGRWGKTAARLGWNQRRLCAEKIEPVVERGAKDAIGWNQVGDAPGQTVHAGILAVDQEDTAIHRQAGLQPGMKFRRIGVT